MKLSTIRIGAVGESLVIANMLKKNMDVYRPCVDDKTIDLLVLINKKPITIQVKNHGYMPTKSSIEVRIRNTNADVIAVPWKDKVFYFINKKKKSNWSMHIAVNKPKNNQNQKVRFAKDFEEFPYDNI